MKLIKKSNILNYKISTNLIIFMKKVICSILFQFDNKLVIRLHNQLYLQFIIYFFKFSSFFQVESLIDYTSEHQLNSKKFKLSLQLLSIIFNTRLIIMYYIYETDSVNSISHIFKSTVWLERELFDMFGVFVLNHPDLRRILTDYGFYGHPLRKDYPLVGYMENFYSEVSKTIVFKLINIKNLKK